MAEAINTARQAGATGLIVVRATPRTTPGRSWPPAAATGPGSRSPCEWTRRSAAPSPTITDDAWTAIEYPNAIYDEQTGEWISDAEIAEVPYTAFASNAAHRTDGRLIVRRVRRLNPKDGAEGQGELFATYRYHAVFTDSPFQLVQAESDHRGHAIIEQVFADLIDGPWAHLPDVIFSSVVGRPVDLLGCVVVSVVDVVVNGVR